MAPLAPTMEEASSRIGRMSLDKTYSGPLQATAHGQMLAFFDQAKGSGGYVAMEEVIGTLDGRKGTFLLQHSSQMVRGVPRQSVIVVPDSGTGDLAGLHGSMEIRIEPGKHFYDFQYELN